MVDGIDGDTTRQAVLRATAAFAREVGARIVAEGVERAEELETLRAMEIDYGQGYLFGRPGPAWPSSAPAPCAAAALRTRRRTRLERELARGAGRARRQRGGRRSPGAPRAAAGCLRALGRTRALPGLARRLAGLRRAAGDGRRRRARAAHRRSAPIIEDVGEAPEFVPGVPGVRAEVCVPLLVGGRVVGVLDVQVLTAVDAGDGRRDRALRGAALRAPRRRSLPESPAARLSRIVALADERGRSSARRWPRRSRCPATSPAWSR